MYSKKVGVYFKYLFKFTFQYKLFHFLRTDHHIKLDNIKEFKKKLLQWANAFDKVVWLDSNEYNQAHSSFDAVLAVEGLSSIQVGVDQGFQVLEDFIKETSDWVFGYLSYDLKNDIEALYSSNFDGLGFSDLVFFQPKKIFMFHGDEVIVRYLNEFSHLIHSDLEKINNQHLGYTNHTSYKIDIVPRTSKESYLTKVNTLQSHINRGDVYEANFCQEFYAHANIDPLATFHKLQERSTPPFSAYMKNGKQFSLSASPERYLKKEGELVISQPIKGTSKRSANLNEDARLKKDLESNPKERSENVMIVDLVRNDLSRIAKKGSVQVDELCGSYTFAQVHHLISTVTAKIKDDYSSVDVIRSTFPMGSMTGAPKIAAMKLIEELEDSKRGLYSGAIGYFTPSGDFDFNVVIRSILYNQEKAYVSFSVGSAITSKSCPESEYEECLVKAKALREALEN
jgi:para-aminobenzoate synthetase component 1